jgi:4-hydroxy-tetrahydrodipicolinate synthase
MRGQPFPVVTKDSLNILGVDVGHPIRPVRHRSEAKRERLRGILDEVSKDAIAHE